jgi:hypothetical protein
MTDGNELERLLRTLSAPRRNHYFYGKLMDVAHFEMEQRYINHKRWLLNQQALGEGVLCGLQVAAQDGMLCVEPGMAVDGYGREIVKPLRTCVDPWTLTDPCGQSQSLLSKEARHQVSLLLCYKECLTDYMPVLVSDCGGEQAAAAGTLVETFALAVREGLPDSPRPALDPQCCTALAGERDPPSAPGTTPEAGEAASAGQGAGGIEARRLELCRCTTDACRTPAEPCVLLAAIELLPGGQIGAIEQCRYRQRIYSNQVLLELILCLATRLEACCKGQDQAETPPKVATVQVLGIQGQVLAEPSDPSAVLTFGYGQLVRSLRVAFTQPILASSVVAGGAGQDPDRQSFQVMEASAGLVPGRLTFEDPQRVRWDTESDAAAVGQYRLRLFGDADPGLGRPAIASAAGVPLDAEPLGLPSGDDAPGGVFELRFDVTGEAGPGEPPKVASVYVLSSQNVVLAYLSDPREVPAIDAANQPRSLRIGFTAEIDPATLVATGADPAQHNVLVTGADLGPIPGTLKVEGPDQVLWTAGVAASLQPGSYQLQLFGDADKQSGRVAIAGAGGLRLDGESDQPLPSGDGTEGGLFRASFIVTGEATGGKRQ